LPGPQLAQPAISAQSHSPVDIMQVNTCIMGT
jgi:hypothetical protein